MGQPRSGESSLAGERFLICHSLIQHFMGSTVVALELVEHLIERGATVSVWAAVIREPMRSLFADSGAHLFDDARGEQPSIDDVDWVWVHSQALPSRIIDQLAEVGRTHVPTFVFHHMSALDIAPDEHPYVPGLEARLSSVSTFVSPSAREHFEGWLPESVPQHVFANPAPESFASAAERPAEAEVRSVLVVSNHPPQEVLDAARLLTERGVAVTVLGHHQSSYGRVTPEVIGAADVVVTIGKTVQYCMVAGVPVYVYDHFGGFGYLTDDNVASAGHQNFSGRGGVALDAAAIADGLVDGYGAARVFHEENRSHWRARYGLGGAVDAVLRSAVARDWVALEKAEAGPFRSAQLFGARYYRMWADDVERAFARAATDRSVAQVHEQLREELMRSESERETARTERARAEAAESEAQALRRSRSYRLGNTVMMPLAALRRWVGRRISRPR